MISLIAALASNRAIGKNNQLLWHIPEDLKYFRRVTRGHTVIMGRKTYESIGRLLPDRENRIVTRQAGYAVEGAKIFGSLEEACQTPDPQQELFVIGGAEIYAQALPLADRLYLTLVEQNFDGDTFFPKWNHLEFKEVSREAYPNSSERPLRFSFVLLERIKNTF